jgi:hypothetical protein
VVVDSLYKGGYGLSERLGCEVAVCVGKGLYFWVLAYLRLKNSFIHQERGLKIWRI